MHATLKVATVFAIAAITSTARAQSIQYTANDRTVTIYGTNNADTVEVENYNFFGEKIKVEIEYWDAAKNKWRDKDETYDADEVDKIIFYGYAGDDYFECEDDDDIKADCYLIGGTGFDTLIGGPNDDYIDGGYDGEMDTLCGGRGADTFVRWYELEERPITVRPFTTIWFPPSLLNLLNPLPIAINVVRVYEYEDLHDFLSAEGDTIDAREAP
ncbi:MAG: hypothetical protein AB8G99_25860 [Planctomycetaceae bacterium]